MVRLSAQISPDERIDLAIHDGLNITRLFVGPMILDHRVRLEYIRTDLAAPLDVLLNTLELSHLSLFFLFFLLKELGTQHLETLLAILQLRTLILALNHDARRLMRHTNGR